MLFRSIPPVYDQTSALISADLAIYEEWGGLVGEWEAAEKVARALGDKPAALLAHHWEAAGEARPAARADKGTFLTRLPLLKGLHDFFRH